MLGWSEYQLICVAGLLQCCRARVNASALQDIWIHKAWLTWIRRNYLISPPTQGVDDLAASRRLVSGNWTRLPTSLTCRIGCTKQSATKKTTIDLIFVSRLVSAMGRLPDRSQPKPLQRGLVISPTSQTGIAGSGAGWGWRAAGPQ